MLAGIAAHQGRADDCRRLADETLTSPAHAGWLWWPRSRPGRSGCWT